MEKELKKLKRLDLLEMLYEQSKKIDIQQEKIEELNDKLEDKTIVMDNAGSIAEAVVGLTDIFTVAQQSADMYVSNVKNSKDALLKHADNPQYFKRVLKVSLLYTDRIIEDMKTLQKEFMEYQQLLRLMEASLK